MKTSQKTVAIVAIAVAVCLLIVASVVAAPAAPDVTISKSVSPRTINADYTGVLTYTITLTNHYTDTIEDVQMWDVLHPMLSFGAWITDEPANFVEAGNIISWTTDLEEEAVLTFTFTAQLPGPQTMQTIMMQDGEIVNTAYFSFPYEDTIVIGTPATATTRFYRYIFLPLVMRSFAQ